MYWQNRINNAAMYWHNWMNNAAIYWHNRMNNAAIYWHNRMNDAAMYWHNWMNDAAMYWHNRMNNTAMYWHNQMWQEKQTKHYIHSTSCVLLYSTYLIKPNTLTSLRHHKIILVNDRCLVFNEFGMFNRYLVDV